MTNNINENGINERTAKTVIAIIFIALLVFGVAATIFGIQNLRDYNVAIDRYQDLMNDYRELKGEYYELHQDRREIECEFNNYKIQHNEGSDCTHDNTRACMKVSKEYLKEFLYNSYETVGFGEESKLNDTIDKILNMMDD